MKDEPVLALGAIGTLGTITLAQVNEALATIAGMLTVTYLIVKLYYKLKYEKSKPKLPKTLPPDDDTTSFHH